MGNVEILMKGRAEMRLGLLERIGDVVDVPLVLHGGSGIPDDTVGALIERGVCKMNLGAMLDEAFLNGMQHVVEEHGEDVSAKYLLGSGLEEDMLAGGELAMKALVERKMAVYGSAGKAIGH